MDSLINSISGDESTKRLIQVFLNIRSNLILQAGQSPSGCYIVYCIRIHEISHTGKNVLDSQGTIFSSAVTNVDNFTVATNQLLEFVALFTGKRVLTTT